MKRLLAAWRAFSIILAATLVIVAAMEAVARLAVRDIGSNRPKFTLNYSDDDLRKLYATNDPGFYREVLAEGWGTGIKRRYEPFVEFLNVPNPHGKKVTVSEDGWRVVPGHDASPSAPGRKIFVFGGSTTFGMGVANHETIPAYLQEALAGAGVAASVHNLGVVAYFSTQELILFERMMTDGFRPDIVVFIDGLNDFYYCEIPSRSEMSDLIEHATAAASHRSLLAVVAQRSNVVRLVQHYSGVRRIGDQPGAHCRDASTVDAVVRRLDVNRRLIAAIGRAMDIVPIFVQQPVPTYAYDNARRAVPLPDPAALGYHRNAAVGYARMRELRDQEKLLRDGVLWLEELTIPENMYVDTVHYSPAFNRAIAKQIAEAIVATGALR